MTETDENLMIAVRGGDLSKLGALFDRHHRKLFDFFVRMTGSRSVADDLVQDVFIRILKYRKTFRDNSLFRAWMFQIARNARLDYYRQHPAEMLLPENHANGLASRAPLPAQEIESAQNAELLKQAMFRLSSDKREVLILSRYHEMNYEQIAELMSCEVGTIKTRVHRAVRELRDIFQQLSTGKSHAMR